jgi:hypothetical protein
MINISSRVSGVFILPILESLRLLQVAVLKSEIDIDTILRQPVK